MSNHFIFIPFDPHPGKISHLHLHLRALLLAEPHFHDDDDNNDDDEIQSSKMSKTFVVFNPMPGLFFTDVMK
jgi:hypothetical protein